MLTELPIKIVYNSQEQMDDVTIAPGHLYIASNGMIYLDIPDVTTLERIEFTEPENEPLQLPSDWNEDNVNLPTFIQNKPTYNFMNIDKYSTQLVGRSINGQLYASNQFTINSPLSLIDTFDNSTAYQLCINDGKLSIIGKD